MSEISPGGWIEYNYTTPSIYPTTVYYQTPPSPARRCPSCGYCSCCGRNDEDSAATKEPGVLTSFTGKCAKCGYCDECGRTS